MTNVRDCQHGQLARSCEVCELEAERDEWRERAVKTLVFWRNRTEKAEAELRWVDDALDRAKVPTEEYAAQGGGVCGFTRAGRIDRLMQEREKYVLDLRLSVKRWCDRALKAEADQLHWLRNLTPAQRKEWDRWTSHDADEVEAERDD